MQSIIAYNNCANKCLVNNSCSVALHRRWLNCEEKSCHNSTHHTQLHYSDSLRWHDYNNEETEQLVEVPLGSCPRLWIQSTAFFLAGRQDNESCWSRSISPRSKLSNVGTSVDESITAKPVPSPFKNMRSEFLTLSEERTTNGGDPKCVWAITQVEAHKSAGYLN